MSTSTSVTSIVSVNSISSATACSDNSVSLSLAGSTRTACEIPVFPVSSASFVISLGTASSAAVSELSLCSYLGSASSEISEFSLGTASSAAISELSECSYLGSSVSVTFVSSLVCVTPGVSLTSVTTGSIFSVALVSIPGSETSVTCVSSFSSSVSYTVDCDVTPLSDSITPMFSMNSHSKSGMSLIGMTCFASLVVHCSLSFLKNSAVAMSISIGLTSLT